LSLCLSLSIEGTTKLTPDDPLDFRADVGFKYVKVGYRIVYHNTLAFAILVGLMAISVQLLRMAESGEINNLWKTAVQTQVQSSMIQTIGFSAALAFGLAWYMFARRTPVYLVDFSVLKPPEEWKVCMHASS
jgi:hypothetical protein